MVIHSFNYLLLQKLSLDNIAHLKTSWKHLSQNIHFLGADVDTTVDVHARVTITTSYLVVNFSTERKQGSPIQETSLGGQHHLPLGQKFHKAYLNTEWPSL